MSTSGLATPCSPFRSTSSCCTLCSSLATATFAVTGASCNCFLGAVCCATATFPPSEAAAPLAVHFFEAPPLPLLTQGFRFPIPALAAAPHPSLALHYNILTSTASPSTRRCFINPLTLQGGERGGDRKENEMGGKKRARDNTPSSSPSNQLPWFQQRASIIVCTIRTRYC